MGAHLHVALGVAKRVKDAAGVACMEHKAEYAESELVRAQPSLGDARWLG